MDYHDQDVALLLLRLAVAWVFLYAAWMNSRDRAARDWTANETAILFRGTPLAGRTKLIRWFAMAGVAIMYLGGLGILLGVLPRLAGLMLFLFTGPGIVIHIRNRADSMKLGGEVAAAVPAAQAGSANALMWLAYAGHHSSALKNYALLGAAAFFVLAEEPVGRFALRVMV
ncbi:MAG TPA: DoxX family membrane protein [Allosphingosinicella sp.]|nr:DoxX family membrane protein [Allosphingosinicella sp.]